MKERGAAMIPTEDIMPIVKNTIAASIKWNTHRGYIGWSSCDNICMDMHDCLDMCAETLEMRGYMVALEAATYILAVSYTHLDVYKRQAKWSIFTDKPIFF